MKNDIKKMSIFFLTIILNYSNLQEEWFEFPQRDRKITYVDLTNIYN